MVIGSTLVERTTPAASFRQRLSRIYTGTTSGGSNGGKEGGGSNGGRGNGHVNTEIISLRWVHCTGRDALPAGAVLAGEDPDGDLLYVGRAYHDDNQLPAKVGPGKGFAVVSNAGQVVRKESFEVLCCGKVSWVRPEHGSVIPPKAIIGGRTSTGEALYIGRGYSPVKLMMGKIVPREQTLYIAYGGWEYPTTQYEYLVEG
uniref:DUF3421 domain-containing protein n=1 Tax=Anopheles atroparvus TaxID=41427 RepID=A0A182IVV7_ANOAO